MDFSFKHILKGGAGVFIAKQMEGQLLGMLPSSLFSSQTQTDFIVGLYYTIGAIAGMKFIPG